jgi:hypothetical protein
MTFAAGTPISTPSGPIAIEHLVAPGFVWASNLEPVACTPFPVRAARATVVALDFGDETIRCAPDRPFFTAVWTLAKRLRPGMHVWCRDGSWKQLAAIEFLDDTVSVYEVSVDQLRTFFVGASELLVSNH